MKSLSTIERALEMVRTGELTNLADIRRRLKGEGYDSVDQHVSGSLVAQIKKMISSRG